MGEDMIVKPELIIIHPKVRSYEEVLTLTSGRLYEYGYVTKDFQKSLINREKNFPTGIELGDINVAIPHTDSIYVNRTTLSVVVLDETVKFKQMGMNSKEVDISLIINMAIKDGKQQVEFLKKIMELIQDTTNLEKILNARNEVEVSVILNDKLN